VKGNRIKRLFGGLRVAPGLLLKSPDRPPRPVHMHLEHTTRCDHICSTCIRSQQIDSEEDMPVERAKAYLDAVQPSFVSLNGIGEPLLHPDWDQIARYTVERHGAGVGMATTGTLLRDNAQRLVDSGVGLVKVSFHGGRPETFARLAAGRSMDTVTDGLSALMEAVKVAGHGPQVRLNYVVTRDNFQEIGPAVRVAHSCGVDTVYFKGALLLEGLRGQIRADEDLAAVADAFADGLEAARSLGVETNLGHWLNKTRAQLACADPQARAEPHSPCLIPWLSLFVRVDGTILPCCNFTFRPGEGELGKLIEDGDLDHHWRGEAQRRLRAEMLSGNCSLQACRECPEPVTLPLLTEAARRKLWPGFLT